MKNRFRNFLILGVNYLVLGFMPLLSGSIDECCACEAHGTWCFQKEMILWKTYEDGLDYTTKKSDILTTENFTKRSAIVPSFHWEYGFRLQAGYTPCYSPWEFTLSWAYLASKATGSKHHNSDAPNFHGIFPIWSFSRNTLKGDYVSDADFNWHLHTSIIDFKTSYTLCPWEKITFTPFIGIEGAILNQKVHVQYCGGTFLSRIDDNLSRNRFWGVGPLFGSGVAYHLFRKFSFKGLAALTPMYGHFNISSREHYLEKTRYRHSNTTNCLVWAYDYRIGFQWEGKTLSCWPDVLLALYWESHTFLKQNRMPRGRYRFAAKNRDLTLEGWTATATFCF